MAIIGPEHRKKISHEKRGYFVFCIMYIQSDSIIKASILGSDIIGHCEKGTLYELVSNA